MESSFSFDEPKFLEVVQEATQERKTMIADIGAGNGASIPYIRRLFNHSTTLVALDISKQSLLECKRLHSSTSVILADGQHLPFKTRTFDVVFCLMVVEHIPNDIYFLKELSETLKHGGMICLSSVIKRGAFFYLYRNSEGHFVLDSTHVREYRSETELLNKIDEAGFSVTTFRIRRIYRSLVDLLISIVLRSAKPKQNAIEHLSFNNSFYKGVRFLRTPLPFYFQIEILAEKSG
jgi:2-polyprenyl-3-methyl-5-hydroxy-6-metoxy-1,4-benzoquinol methylase